jgi:hypothetical protein
MARFSKYLPFAFFIGFFLVALAAFIESKPADKNTRIYKAVQPCNPYYFEKRLGGLAIRKKGDPDFKEKPSNMQLYHEYERLEKAWGSKAMKLHGDTLEVYDENGSLCTRITLQNDDERTFVRNYYGVSE